MKKKLSIFVLMIIVIPILAFFGCGTPTSYKIEAVSSWTGIPTESGGGTVQGGGSYEEGKTVTLTAIAKPNSRFIAWVFEDSVLITDNSSYSIKNTTSSNVVTRSELSFKASSTLKGRYIAVFDDSKIVYTKLTSWRVTENYLVTGVDESNSIEQNSMKVEMYLSQGSVNKEIFSVSAEIKNNVKYPTAAVNEILKLNAESAQDVIVDFTVTSLKENASFSKVLRAQIPFQENDDQLEDLNYPYKVTYSESGIYEVIYKFSINSTDWYLVLEYSNLNSIY